MRETRREDFQGVIDVLDALENQRLGCCSARVRPDDQKSELRTWQRTLQGAKDGLIRADGQNPVRPPAAKPLDCGGEVV